MHFIKYGNVLLFSGTSRSKLISDTDDDLLDMTSFSKSPYHDDSEDDPLLGDRTFQGNDSRLV